MSGGRRAGPVDPADGLDPATVEWGDAGLVPAIVQDAWDGRILMLAWIDAEALLRRAASLGKTEYAVYLRRLVAEREQAGS